MMSGHDNMVSEPLIPVVPRIEMAMSAAEEERCKAMLDKILAKMDEQGRKMDDMISTLMATTTRLLGAAADSTPSSSSTTVGFATISSWAIAAHPAVNTVDTDTNFAMPTKCSTSGPDPNVDDAKVTTTPLLSGGVPTALRVHVERAKASSPRSFAIGELDTVMPPRCSMFCHNSNTGDVDVATVTLLETGESKVIPAPMAPPLEYSPKSFANVKLDNEKFTRCATLCSSHDAGVSMPTGFPSPTLSMFAKLDVALAYSDEESHDREETETRPRVLLSLMTVADLEATPAVVIPATVMNLDIACDVALINLITVIRLCAECISVEPSTRREQYVVQQQLFLELGFISGVAQQVLEELFKNGTVVLWPLPLKWVGGNLWPPPSQVKIAGSRARPWPVARMSFRYRQGNAQLKPPWLLPTKVPSLLFTYKQAGVQWISPWPPPPQGCIVDFMLLDKE